MRTGRQLLVWAMVGVGLLLGTGTAFAHNVLVGSDPADRSSLPAGPSQVTLKFDLPVQESFSTVTVVGPNGNHFEAGQAKVDGNSVTAPVSPLGPAGQYTVGYRIVSDDGHPVSGSISFTLTNPGPGQGVPAGSAPGASGGSGAVAPVAGAPAESGAGSDSGGIPAWPWVVGGIVLVAAGVTVALRLGRGAGD
ncbi:copper resistance CopC family protein [Pseudonocardia acaciae]|uniref:copper resistance CopC family protein n=1 Tax=Pseudonocardia acaciae TaxID=551276 RepID=UPI00048C142F|nr:copper resistance CopC family protein [Pseudonocardia acaciae]